MGPVAPKFTRQTDKEGEFAEGVASRPPKRLQAEEYMGEGRDRGGSESPEPVQPGSSEVEQAICTGATRCIGKQLRVLQWGRGHWPWH